MNERIEKMAEQASEYASKKDMTGEYVIAFDQDKYNEKFAELLIREFADYAEYQLQIGGTNADKIKQHFGVK